MSSFQIELEHKDTDKSISIGIQISDADAAMLVMKRHYPDYKVIKIQPGPDMIRADLFPDTGLIVLKTPHIDLNILIYWEIKEVVELIKIMSVDNISNESNSMITPFTEHLKKLFINLCQIVLEKI